MKKCLIIVLFALLAGCALYRRMHEPSRGPLPPEFVERTVNVEGKERKFRVLLPAGREPDRKLPVMLFLHGSGESGDNNKEPSYSFASATEGIRERMNLIVVLPQCAANSFWSTNEMATYAMAALDAAIGEFNGDESRTYLAGFSLGGYGTMHIAAAFPERFAAVVPIAGGVGGDVPRSSDRDVALPPSIKTMLESPDPVRAVTGAIGQTPVWVFHGAKDRSVPVDSSRKIVEAFKNNGNMNVRYTEYENEGHLILSKAFAEPGFLEWLEQQNR